MGREASVGELEHLILLAILALGEEATAIRIRSRLGEEGRAITRGALYRSLDRLGEKELIGFSAEEPSPERGGHTRRLYTVSAAGLEVVRERRVTLERLWAEAAEAAR
jgi:DNA-binding PadR family transcriptional regulator